MNIPLILVIFWLGVLLGSFCGNWISESRWRNNADKPYRIESGGRLFKVHRADVPPDPSLYPLLRNTPTLKALLQAVHAVRNARRAGRPIVHLVHSLCNAADAWDASSKK